MPDGDAFVSLARGASGPEDASRFDDEAQDAGRDLYQLFRFFLISKHRMKNGDARDCLSVQEDCRNGG